MPAHGHVRIEQVGQRGEYPADQQRRHAPDGGQQQSAQSQPGDDGAHAEKLRRECDVVISIFEFAKIERIGESAPDRVADAIGQHDRQNQHERPSHPPDELDQWQHQRTVEVIEDVIAAGGGFLVRCQQVFSAALF